MDLRDQSRSANKYYGSRGCGGLFGKTAHNCVCDAPIGNRQRLSTKTSSRSLWNNLRHSSAYLYSSGLSAAGSRSDSARRPSRGSRRSAAASALGPHYRNAARSPRGPRPVVARVVAVESNAS